MSGIGAWNGLGGREDEWIGRIIRAGGDGMAWERVCVRVCVCVDSQSDIRYRLGP